MVILYFALAYAWTWVCWWSVVAHSRDLVTLPISDSTLSTLGQFGPFAAALVVISAAEGRAGLRDFCSRFLRWRASPVWLLVALFLLPATMFLAIYSYALMHGTEDTLRFREPWATLIPHFTYLMILGGPLGEEPGWRGFALPRLQARFGPIIGSVLLGLLHAGWHLPLWWMHRPPCPFWMYTIGVVLVSGLFTWLFNHTGGSLLYVLIFHASLSIGSVRLPDVPAYHLWVSVLFLLTSVILLFDRRLGSDRNLEEQRFLTTCAHSERHHH
jgi:uncharacterized protein